MSKLTWGIWQILTRALESLKNFHFNGFLLGKVCIVWTKKVQRSYFSWNWRGMQNLENNQLVVSKLTQGIWQILTRALESLKNFHFNRLLLSKVYIVWDKKVQRSYLSWNWRGIQNLERNRLVVSNLPQGIWQMLTWALKSLKDFYFNGLFMGKVYVVWTKKLERSYPSWHWRWMQNLKKNWLVAWKMTRGIWQIFTRALESVKIGTLMGPFAQSRKCMTLKFTEELCVMTMKNYTKTEEELTCRFKTDMRNFTNFDPSTQKSKKCVF